MFHVKDGANKIRRSRENFEEAKAEALKLKEETKENFAVYEVKQVWTTQTLDEVMGFNPDKYGENDPVVKRIENENDKAMAAAELKIIKNNS